MQKKLFTTLLVGAGFFLAGCGDEAKDVSDEVGQHIEHRNLMKTWAADCKGSSLFGLSTRQIYKFGGNDFKEAYVLYSDDKCQDKVGTLKYSGNMVIGNEVGNSDIFPVDYKYKKVTLRVEDGDIADIVEEFCEIERMEPGKEVDVTKESGSADCPIRSVPRNEFGVYQVSGETLYLAESRPEKRSDRPKSVDADAGLSVTDESID
jgi:hypothetical protein